MKFEKVVQGNFNLTHQMFGKQAGKQSSMIVLFSVCWTKIRRISLWKSFDLDYVLHKGDTVFKDLKVEMPLNVKDFPDKIFVEQSCFDIKVIHEVEGKKPLNNDCTIIDLNLLFRDNLSSAILFSNELCVAILKNKHNHLYIFDSRSYDSSGKLVENCKGKSILIEFSDIKSLSEYIFTSYDFALYQLVYIEVSTQEITIPLEKSLEKFKRTKLYHEHLDKSQYEKVEDRLKKNRKRHYDKFSADIKERSKKFYVDHSEDVKKRNLRYKENQFIEIKHSDKRYKLDHSDQIKHANKKYREDHSDQIKHTNKKYKEEHSHQVKDSNKKYKQKYSDNWARTPPPPPPCGGG